MNPNTFMHYPSGYRYAINTLCLQAQMHKNIPNNAMSNYYLKVKFFPAEAFLLLDTPEGASIALAYGLNGCLV